MTFSDNEIVSDSEKSDELFLHASKQTVYTVRLFKEEKLTL